jgi:hypothetical protein
MVRKHQQEKDMKHSSSVTISLRDVLKSTPDEELLRIAGAKALNDVLFKKILPPSFWDIASQLQRDIGEYEGDLVRDRLRTSTKLNSTASVTKTVAEELHREQEQRFRDLHAISETWLARLMNEKNVGVKHPSLRQIQAICVSQRLSIDNITQVLHKFGRTPLPYDDPWALHLHQTVANLYYAGRGTELNQAGILTLSRYRYFWRTVREVCGDVHRAHRLA